MANLKKIKYFEDLYFWVWLNVLKLIVHNDVSCKYFSSVSYFVRL